MRPLSSAQCAMAILCPGPVRPLVGEGRGGGGWRETDGQDAALVGKVEESEGKRQE